MSDAIMKLADCAAEIQMKADTIIGWIKGGHLVAILPPGADPLSRQRGPKGYRVLRSDWDAFLKAHRYTGSAARVDPPQQATAPPKGIPTGTDGIKRRGIRSRV